MKISVVEGADFTAGFGMPFLSDVTVLGLSHSGFLGLDAGLQQRLYFELVREEAIVAKLWEETFQDKYTRMKRMKRIFADKTKENPRKSVSSVSSAFHLTI
jgi:hypothetical protein